MLRSYPKAGDVFRCIRPWRGGPDEGEVVVFLCLLTEPTKEWMSVFCLGRKGIKLLNTNIHEWREVLDA